jgi:hypothetical protein
MVRWFGSSQQLIIDCLDEIADGSTGKSENPSMLKPRKRRGPRRQRKHLAPTFAVVPKR